MSSFFPFSVSTDCGRFSASDHAGCFHHRLQPEAAPNSYSGSDRRASRPAICRVAPAPQKSIRANTPATQSDGLTPQGRPQFVHGSAVGQPTANNQRIGIRLHKPVTGRQSNQTVGVRHFGTARPTRDRCPRGKQPRRRARPIAPQFGVGLHRPGRFVFSRIFFPPHRLHPKLRRCGGKKMLPVFAGPVSWTRTSRR